MGTQFQDSEVVFCLYIEPHEDTIQTVREQLNAWFGKNALRVFHADRLEQGIEALAVRPYDLILTDIHFPDSTLSPKAIISQIKSHPNVRETPIVVITEMPGHMLASEVFGAGAAEYINLASAAMQPDVGYHRIGNLIHHIHREKILVAHAEESIKLIADFHGSEAPKRDLQLSIQVNDLKLKCEELELQLRAQEEENNRLMSSFSMYVDPKVIQNVVLGREEELHKGQRRDITILFSDLRGYTRMSKDMKSEDIVSFLNQYYTAMTEVIMGYNGLVDKYMGDGIMCMFGAPLKDPDHSLHAMQAAIEMQSVFELWSENWKKSFGIQPAQAIGLACGNAVVGNLGSFQKVSYTAIGSVVNLASRLEAVAEEGDIVISEELYNRVADELRDECSFEALPPIAIKGLDGRHRIYRMTKEIDLDSVLVEG